MIRSEFEQRPLDAAIADAGNATLEFDRARGRIVLVRHPWRGLVPPGGKVEPGECPRDGAARKLAEETGLRPALLKHRPPPMQSERRPAQAPPVRLAPFDSRHHDPSPLRLLKQPRRDETLF
ncbi:NUDIX domain-containing protein [Streptomyces sp. NPDC008265]|uniref:NUDIX hydrolase n=1 Tax=Streptomyces sp. NPDC008265 TaxID=3364824 RepID=UPI0036E51833